MYYSYVENAQIRSFCTDKAICANSAIIRSYSNLTNANERTHAKCDSNTLRFACDVCCHTTHYQQHLTSTASSSVKLFWPNLHTERVHAST
jgi:hypothetical protein